MQRFHHSDAAYNRLTSHFLLGQWIESNVILNTPEHMKEYKGFVATFSVTLSRFLIFQLVGAE